MDIQNLSNKYPSNNIENFYKFSSNGFPKSTMDDMYSRYSTRFETKNKSDSNTIIKKQVTFNKNVTVINIQSYKKEMKKNFYRNQPGIFNEEFIKENKMK